MMMDNGQQMRDSGQPMADAGKAMMNKGQAAGDNDITAQGRQMMTTGQTMMTTGQTLMTLVHPVAQRPFMNTEITGDLSNGAARRQHDIDGTVLEVLIKLSTFL